MRGEEQSPLIWSEARQYAVRGGRMSQSRRQWWEEIPSVFVYENMGNHGRSPSQHTPPRGITTTMDARQEQQVSVGSCRRLILGAWSSLLNAEVLGCSDHAHAWTKLAPPTATNRQRWVTLPHSRPPLRILGRRRLALWPTLPHLYCTFGR
jgi:hypothetical protein